MKIEGHKRKLTGVLVVIVSRGVSFSLDPTLSLGLTEGAAGGS